MFSVAARGSGEKTPVPVVDGLFVWATERARGFLTKLTLAERQITSDMAQGLTNREIAARRGRSLRTVANQVASIFSKTGVASRAELFAKW
ncbi:MAG: LuxR C-terminal-related transcriptional regulator [Polyangiaceae bacterium]